MVINVDERMMMHERWFILFVLLCRIDWIWQTPANGSDEGPVLWPPRSSDLIRLEFLPWGNLKEFQYQCIVSTQTDLNVRLHIGCISVAPVAVTYARIYFPVCLSLP
ncbi:hypothetical protein TNCV_1271981 [Trichonephila clavipes]|nr:hypothetical protein TNCV_1271981 [Trichonephila clavipes]